jgi:hypothetical protein
MRLGLGIGVPYGSEAVARIPVNAILFNGEPILFNGEFIIYTS